MLIVIVTLAKEKYIILELPDTELCTGTKKKTAKLPSAQEKLLSTLIRS